MADGSNVGVIERPMSVNTEVVKRTPAEGFRAKAESLLAAPQTRTILTPSYERADTLKEHRDPTKKLIASRDVASNTSFLVESLPMDDTSEDRHLLVRWERSDTSGADDEPDNGWIRVILKKGQEPSMILASNGAAVHQKLLPGTLAVALKHGYILGAVSGGEYQDGAISHGEKVTLSQQAIENVLARLKASEVNPELTEKIWKQAERYRLECELGNASHLALIATHEGYDSDAYKKVSAYEEKVEAQYKEFCRQQGIVIPDRPEISPEESARFKRESEKYEAYLAANPEAARVINAHNRGDLTRWLGYNKSNPDDAIVLRMLMNPIPINSKDKDKDDSKKGDQDSTDEREEETEESKEIKEIEDEINQLGE